DEDRDSQELEDLVSRFRLGVESENVTEAGTAAPLHSDAQAMTLRNIVLFSDCRDLFGRLRSQRDLFVQFRLRSYFKFRHCRSFLRIKTFQVQVLPPRTSSRDSRADPTRLPPSHLSHPVHSSPFLPPLGEEIA